MMSRSLRATLILILAAVMTTLPAAAQLASRSAEEWNVARYLKPGGRFAIVEPDARTGPHRNDRKLQVTKGQLKAWMADSGFVPSHELHLFDNKWYVIYVRK